MRRFATRQALTCSNKGSCLGVGLQASVLKPIVGVRYLEEPRLGFRHREPMRKFPGLLGLLPP